MKLTLTDARRVPLVPLLILLAGWVFIFRDDFSLFPIVWDSEDFSYTLLVPFVALYAVWQERAAILNSAGGARWPGLVGLALSGGLLFTGRMGSLETLTFMAIWLSILSIAIMALGWNAWRSLLFPAFLLLFIVPPPPFIERNVSFQLRLLSSTLSAQLLQLLSVPVYLEGNIIDLGLTKLQVVDACSGLRYLIPTILLSLVTGFMMANAFISRVALLFLSVPISLALNAIRITVTGLLVRYVSLDLAQGFFHDFQGWAIYLAAIAMLGSASLWLKGIERRHAAKHAAPAEAPAQPVTEAPSTEADTQPESSETTADPPAPSAPASPPPAAGRPLTPLLAAIGAAILVLISVGTGSFMRAQVIPAWKPLENFPLQLGPWHGVRGVLDKAVIDGLWCDDYFMGDYKNRETGSALSILVPYYKAQTTSHTAHAPTSCFLGSGWELTKRTLLPPSPQTGRPFPVVQMILEKNGGKLLSNFWFQQRGRIITNEFQNKWLLFTDAISKRRTDGALVRIEMILPPSKSPDAAQVELDFFAGQAQRNLQDFLPQ